MHPDDLVRDHYSGDDLEGTVLRALEAAGLDVDALQVGDLAGLDQLHAGAGPATEHVLDALDLAPGMSLLDVGCGVGGPARLAAARTMPGVTSSVMVDVTRSTSPWPSSMMRTSCSASM